MVDKEGKKHSCGGGGAGGHLHDDGSEGFHLLHVACSERRACMGVEHDQIDLALNLLHQFHQPACAYASAMQVAVVPSKVCMLNAAWSYT